MFDISLEISSIQAQVPKEEANLETGPKETSLERILDELDKREEPVYVRNRTKRISAPISKSQNPPMMALNTKPSLIISNEHQPVPSNYQRVSRQLLTHKVFADRPSPFVIARSDVLPSSLSQNPQTSRRMVNYPNSEDEVKLFHARRLSSPNVFGLLQPQVKLSAVASTMSGSNINSPRSPIEPRFNISYPIRPTQLNSVGLVQSTMLMSPAKSVNFPSTRTLQIPENSPRITSIDNDYLLKVLSNKGNNPGGMYISNQSGGSIVDSPTSVGSPNRSDFRAKRGSFSVFKKIVEAELSSKNV